MEADLVVADRLAPRELLAELPADTEIVDVAKLPRGRATTQEQINQSSSRPPSPVAGWPGSREATPSSSAAGSRRCSPAARRGSR